MMLSLSAIPKHAHLPRAFMPHMTIKSVLGSPAILALTVAGLPGLWAWMDRVHVHASCFALHSKACCQLLDI